MPKYMLIWAARDHQTLQSGFDFPVGVKAISSVHVIGEGRGYVLVETDKPALVTAAVLRLKPQFEVIVEPVLLDEEVRPVLKSLSATAQSV